MARIIDSDGNAHETDNELLEMSTDVLETTAYVAAMMLRDGGVSAASDLLVALAYRLEGYRLTFTRDAQITASDLDGQRQFSTKAFGPGRRTGGVLDHIRKELEEVEAHPTDLLEWVDVVILALDGAWRAGHEPEAIIKAYHSKMEANRARIWPDWRELSEDVAIEHDRSAEANAERIEVEAFGEFDSRHDEYDVISPIAHEHVRMIGSHIPATTESVADVCTDAGCSCRSKGGMTHEPESDWRDDNHGGI